MWLFYRQFHPFYNPLNSSVDFLCLVWGSGTHAPGLEPHKCLYISIWMKGLGCHVGHQNASRCHTKGESEESVVCRRWSMQVRKSTLALKPRADVTRKNLSTVLIYCSKLDETLEGFQTRVRITRASICSPVSRLIRSDSCSYFTVS